MADSNNPDRPPYKLDPWQTIRSINFGSGHNYLRISNTNAAQFRYGIIYPNSSEAMNTHMVTPRKGFPPVYGGEDPHHSTVTNSLSTYLSGVVTGFEAYDTGATYIGDGRAILRIRPIEKDVFGYLERTYGAKFYGIGWSTWVLRWTYGAHNSPTREVTLWNLDNLFADFPDQDIFEWHVIALARGAQSFWMDYRNHEAQYVDATWWQGAHPDTFNWCATWGSHFDYSNGSENGMMLYFPSVTAANAGRQVFRRKSAMPLTYDYYQGYENEVRHAWETTPHMRIRLIRSTETLEFYHNGSQKVGGTIVEQPDEAYHLINPIREHLPYYGIPNYLTPNPRPPGYPPTFLHPGQ